MKTKEFSLNQNSISGGIRSYHSLLAPQKRSYSAHHHTQCEPSVFLSGEGIYTVGKTEYRFHAGDVFLFASDEEHCITEISADLELLNLQFEPYILWENPDAMELMPLFHSRNSEFKNLYSDKDGEVCKTLLTIEDEMCHQRPCFSVIVKYRLFSALTIILRNHPGVNHQKTVKATDHLTQSIKLTIDYIQRNFERKLTLEELARIACLSPTYFSYIFKKLNGISLWKYINIKRVERAIEILKSENVSKLEIAERCGFSSSSNFYKTFFAITGKTPSNYTKQK
jgi:AraC-like DNA-binding protein